MVLLLRHLRETRHLDHRPELIKVFYLHIHHLGNKTSIFQTDWLVVSQASTSYITIPSYCISVGKRDINSKALESHFRLDGNASRDKRLKEDLIRIANFG